MSPLRTKGDIEEAEAEEVEAEEEEAEAEEKIKLKQYVSLRSKGRHKYKILKQNP
jgi:hypothetical protein